MDSGEAGKRPFLVTLLALLYIIWGIFMVYTLYQGVMLGLNIPGLVDISGDLILGIDFYIVDIAILASINILMFLSGVGLLKLKLWGYYSAIGLAVIGALSSILFLPISILGIILNLGIIYYLTRARVRRSFTW
ncbi:TPA: hypothetical protein EYP83_03800 [Candidatus Geothermarchaeota archaeon]|nr:hypothetical protein [Candidatus Geothermarchaeota archaeon]HIQ12887.1 hypothetical protein [Thermoprotei archaeon]